MENSINVTTLGTLGIICIYTYINRCSLPLPTHGSLCQFRKTDFAELKNAIIKAKIYKLLSVDNAMHRCLVLADMVKSIPL